MRILATVGTLAIVLLASCETSAMKDPAAPPDEVPQPQTLAEPMTEQGATQTPSGEPSGHADMAEAVNPGPDNGLQVPPAPAQPAPATPFPAPKRDGQAHRYELRTFGTDIEVYMDGDRVPAERLMVRDGHVGVLDANGTVIERMQLPADWMKPESTPDPSVLGGNPYNFRTIGGAQLTPPKVMLGAHLVDAPPALLAHLAKDGVQRNRVALVTELIPGLPLDQAGIREHDLIIAVNDIPDADPESIRAVLRGMQPGEPIALRVLRNGETIETKVTVAAWEPKHMVRPLGAGSGAGRAPAQAASAASAAPNASDELRAEIAALKAQMAEDRRALEAARAAAAPAPAAPDADVARAREAMAAEIAALKSELQRQQAQLQAAREASAPASAPAAGDAELARLRAELDAARASADGTGREIAALRAQLADAQRTAALTAPGAMDEAMRAELADLKARMARLQREQASADAVRRAIRPAATPQPAPKP